MTKAEIKLVEIYNILAQEVNNSSWYFSIAQELNKKFIQNEIIRGKRLLYFSYFACLRETLLSLSKVYFKDKDSITFHFLKSHLVNNRNLPGSIGAKDITTLEKGIDLLIEKQAPLFDKIKPLRDKNLAHIDKKNINDPKVIVPESFDFDEINNCIKDFSTLMIKISGMDDKFHYPNVNPSQIIQQDLESLLS